MYVPPKGINQRERIAHVRDVLVVLSFTMVLELTYRGNAHPKILLIPSCSHWLVNVNLTSIVDGRIETIHFREKQHGLKLFQTEYVTHCRATLSLSLYDIPCLIWPIRVCSLTQKMVHFKAPLRLLWLSARFSLSLSINIPWPTRGKSSIKVRGTQRKRGKEKGILFWDE